VACENAPLKLSYKDDAARAQQRMRAYWQGEMIDRPCIAVQSPKSGMTQPKRSLITSFDFEKDIAEFEEWASCTFFGGESMPRFMPWYGPDQWAAFFGAEMSLRPDMDTSWVEPFVEDWDDLSPLTADPENKWWKGIIELAKLGAEKGEGKFLISNTDTHSNLDCMSAIRSPARLCMDLIENPDGVLRAVKWVDALYKPAYDAISEAGKMTERGSTSWLDMYSDGRTQVIQCDFCYMISPEHFRKFALPSLEHEMSCLDNATYHLDGAGELAHLDDFLAIPHLHTIQWVPGAGNLSAAHWVDLLQKIQKAGKGVHISVTPDELKAVYKELAPEKTFYSVECESQQKAEELMRWMEMHV
jgi:hypothetical protein